MNGAEHAGLALLGAALAVTLFCDAKFLHDKKPRSISEFVGFMGMLLGVIWLLGVAFAGK